MPPTCTPAAIQLIYAPRLPEILTPKDWEKSKGVFAKIAGKTGIGEALVALEKAFKKVEWKKFQAKALVQGIDWDGFAKHAKIAAQEQEKNGVPLQKELTAVAELASDTAEKFEANKLIPRASTEHVGDLADTAEHYASLMPNMGADFRAMLLEFERAADDGRKRIAAAVKRIDDYAQRALAKPTAKSYTDEDKEQRSLSTIVFDIGRSIAVQPEKEWRALAPEWKRLSAEAFMKGVKDGEPVKAKIAEIQKAVPAMKKVAAALIK